MTRQLAKTIFAAGLGLGLLSQPAQALDNDLTVYLWGASISGKATIGSRTVPQQPVEVDFDDLLDDLDFGFQGHYEGVGDRWGVGLDLTYLKLSNTNDNDVSGEVKGTLSEVFGIYRASEVFDLLAGVRFTGLDVSVDTPRGAGAEGDRSLTDIYAGGRVVLPFGKSWRFGLRGDIGTGDSDLVWNAVALLSWQVGRAVALRGGYRWLDYDEEKDDTKINQGLDFRLEGPFLGVGFLW